MKRFGLALLASLVFSTGCGPTILAIEVLPPRTDSVCSSPTLNDGASGRGLLDLNATDEDHGAYVADLRFSSSNDVLIDGLSVSFKLPKDASGSSEDEADDVSGEQPVGDVLLVGEEDELRESIVENVVILPRSLAKKLRDDDKLDIDATEYETIVVELLATSGGNAIATGLVSAEPATFAIDVCEGCLVTPPAEEDCGESGIEDTEPCRPGQDVESYRCASPASGGLF